jgi:hypothetical protein
MVAAIEDIDLARSLLGMTTERSTNSRMLGLMLGAGLALAGLSLAGCDRDDPRGEALLQASVKLSSLNLSGSGTASEEHKAKTLNEIIATLRPIASEGTPAERGSAGLMLSKSYVGLAETASAEASMAQRDLISQTVQLRSALSRWLSQNAQADALDAYDPASEFADLKAQSESLVKQRQAALDQKAALEAEIKGLMDQAAERASQAKAKREEESRIFSQTAGLTATAAETLVKEAAKVRREGDAFEFEQATLETQAAQRQPNVAEVARTIATIESQQQLLVRSGEQVTKRAETSDAEAKALRAKVVEVQTEIETLVDAIKTVRNDRADSAAAKAIEQYEAAITASRAAQESARPQASSAIAGAQLALGDVHWGQAQGLEAAQSAMGALAAAKPALKDAESYRLFVKQVEPQRTASLTGASEAYKAAMEALDAMGGKGAEVERQRAHVKQRLAEARFVLSNGADDVREEVREATKDHPLSTSGTAPRASKGATIEGGEESEGSRGGAMAGAVGDLSTPQGTIATYIDASGRLDLKAIAELYVKGEIQEMVLMSAGPSMKLDAAMKAKIGQTLTEAVLSDPAMMALAGSNPGMPLPAGVLLEEFMIEQQGEKATASHPKVKTPIALVNVGGQWRLDPNLSPSMKAQTGAMKPLLGKVAGVYDTLTAKVESGELSTTQQVMQALQQEMMKAMMGAAGGRGGGG